MHTRLVSQNSYIRIISAIMEVGDEAGFDVTGEDLGNGFLDTSCHVGWYVTGRYMTRYEGFPEIERLPGVGCAHVTVPDDQYTFPKGRALVRCVEAGRIYFIEQLIQPPPDKWTFDLLAPGTPLENDCIVVKQDGEILDAAAGTQFDETVLFIEIRP